MESTAFANSLRAQTPASDHAQTQRTAIAPRLRHRCERIHFILCGYVVRAASRGVVPSQGMPFSGTTTATIWALGLIMWQLGGSTIETCLARFGRDRTRPMLVAMTLGIVLVGLVPGFDAVDVATPLLVLLARVLEGLQSGGD